MSFTKLFLQCSHNIPIKKKFGHQMVTIKPVTIYRSLQMIAKDYIMKRDYVIFEQPLKRSIAKTPSIPFHQLCAPPEAILNVLFHASLGRHWLAAILPSQWQTGEITQWKLFLNDWGDLIYLSISILSLVEA